MTRAVATCWIPGPTFYEVYETADGKYLSLGSIEPQFYAALLDALGDDAEPFREQWDIGNWPHMKEQLAEVIKRRTRDEWDAVFEGIDICHAPVLSMEEVRHHPHHVARGTFLDDGDVWQPAPAPRFSRTKASAPAPARPIGADSRDVLAEFGLSEEQIASRLACGAVTQAS